MGSWQTHKEHKVWGFMWLCLFYTKGQYWQTRRVWKSTSAPGFAQRKCECQQPKVMDAGDRKSVLDVQMNGGGFCWDILQMETNTFFKWVINIKENCKCKLCHHHMYFEGHITACFLTRRKNAQNRTDNFCKQILILGHSGYSNLAFLWRFLPVFAWAVAWNLAYVVSLLSKYACCCWAATWKELLIQLRMQRTKFPYRDQ